MAYEYSKIKYTNSKTILTTTMICSCGREYTGKVKTKSWKNWCPGCKKSGGMVAHTPPKPNLSRYKGKQAPEGEMTCNYCGYDACAVHGRGKDKRTANMIMKPSGDIALDLKDNVPKSASSSTSEGSGGNLSSYQKSITQGAQVTNSEKTYEDILKDIAKSTDSIFFVRMGILCFATFPALSMVVANPAYKNLGFFKKDNPITKDVIEDGSYEIDVSEFGYYNTVYVKYKGGKAKAFHSELVRVYNEIPITYNEQNLNPEAAQMKAEAYLSAHIRDFDMSVDFNMLTTGKVVPGHFTWIQDEKTNSVEKYFIQSISTNWSDDSSLTTSVTLKYGPKNPDSPYIPEIGKQSETEVVVEKNAKAASVGSKGLAPASGGFTDPCKLTQELVDYASKFKTPEQLCKSARNYLYARNRNLYYTGYKYCPSKCMSGTGCNCMDCARTFVYLCKANGWDARVSNSVKCGSYRHRYAEIKGSNGTWKMCDGNCSNATPALPKAWL